MSHKSESKNPPRFSWEIQPWAVAAPKARARDSWDNNNNNNNPRVAPIPLPPCSALGPTYHCSPRKGPRRDEDDPFLAAYIECTKSVRPPPFSSKERSKPKRGVVGLITCKSTCGGARDDAMVRISRLPAGGHRLLEKGAAALTKGRRPTFPSSNF